jgi:hypothetical protein
MEIKIFGIWFFSRAEDFESWWEGPSKSGEKCSRWKVHMYDVNIWNTSFSYNINFQNLPPVKKILTYILRSIFLEIPHLELPRWRKMQRDTNGKGECHKFLGESGTLLIFKVKGQGYRVIFTL